METELDPRGSDVRIGPITIRTPGLRGEATLRHPGDGRSRGPELGTDELLAAMDQTGAREQYTVELQRLTPRASGAGGGRNRGEDDSQGQIEVAVPAAAEDGGQALLYVAEDGVASWHFPQEAVGAGSADRARAMVIYRLPGAIVPVDAAETGTSRGVVSTVASKVLKFIVFPLLNPLLKEAGNYFSRQFEERNRYERWRTFTPENYQSDQAPPLDREAWRRLSEGPALLFLHGTGAMAHTAFHRLDPAVLQQLSNRYQGRVFALDHYTVCIDPAVNVRHAAAEIPRDLDLEIDIVSHSRGGLVARELAERGGTHGVPSGIRVRTLVMVATPNAGTAIARQKNIKSWLDTMTNVAQLVPDNPVTDILAVVLTVAKHVALGVFDGLEGITSMDPDGPYLRDLNTDRAVSTAYWAVAADFEPVDGSPLKRLHDAVFDVLFDAASNDLVVPTKGVAAVDGLARFAPTSLVLDTSQGVDHSSFFRSPTVTEKLLEWLPG